MASAPAQLEPYPGLDFFSEAEAPLFFGRDRDRARIIANLRAARMTVLHAASGVGKSSLLRAGVAARLRAMAERERQRGTAPAYVPVVFSVWRSDPIGDLIASVRQVAPVELPRTGLRAALDTAAGALSTTLLIMLDQFEECLLHTPDESRSQFADELAQCVNEPVRANFLIALREDAYARLGELFSHRGVDIYGNRLHIDPLDEYAARAAIVKPLEYINAHAPDAATTIEPEVVDAVLNELQEFSAPYLQLVMQRLWETERAEGSRTLRVDTLQRLGGAVTIVRDHVVRAFDQLYDRQIDVAADLMRYLVTPSGVKIALSIPDLAELTEHDASDVRAIIDRLTEARILRQLAPDADESDPRVELFHDVLAPAILEWRQRRSEYRAAAEAARADRLRHRQRRLIACLVALVLLELMLIVVLLGIVITR